MLGTLCRRGDERQVDVGGLRAGQLLLGLLSGLFQTLHGHLVAGEVDALFGLELADHPVHDLLVEVIAAQVGVAVGGQNLDDAVADVDDGDIEGTAAQVVDHDLLLGLIVQAVGQGCRCGLVDNTLDFEACDLAGVLGRLTLGVIEICGNSDDGLVDFLTQIALCVRFQLLQDERGDLLRAVLLAVDGAAVVRAHISLDGSDGVVGVGDGLTLCGLADQTLIVLGEGDDGRCCPCALGVRDDSGLAALHDCYTAVCGSQIDTDNLAHDFSFLFQRIIR